MAESMVFYKSFYESLIGLPDESRHRMLDAILQYGLYEREPTDLLGYEIGLFTLAKPQIDANVERRNNGKKGGRKKKPMVSEEKTNGYEAENHRLRNEKPNVNVNANENVNVNANDNANGLNNECITAWGRAQRESDDENPDEDYDLRHQDYGKKYFNETVKIGMIRR